MSTPVRGSVSATRVVWMLAQSPPIGSALYGLLHKAGADPYLPTTVARPTHPTFAVRMRCCLHAVFGGPTRRPNFGVSDAHNTTKRYSTDMLMIRGLVGDQKVADLLTVDYSHIR